MALCIDGKSRSSESCRETFFDFFNPEFHHQKGSPKKLLRCGILFDSLYQLCIPPWDSVSFKYIYIYMAYLVVTFKHDTSSYALRCCASTLSHLKSNNVWKHDQRIPSCTNRNKQSPQIVLFHVSQTCFKFPQIPHIFQILNKPMEKTINSPKKQIQDLRCFTGLTRHKYPDLCQIVVFLLKFKNTLHYTLHYITHLLVQSHLFLIKLT